MTTEDKTRYCDMSDTQAVDAIIFEVEEHNAVRSRCNAGWAMLARLNGLRKEIADLKAEQVTAVEVPPRRSSVERDALQNVVLSDEARDSVRRDDRPVQQPWWAGKDVVGELIKRGWEVTPQGMEKGGYLISADLIKDNGDTPDIGARNLSSQRVEMSEVVWQSLMSSDLRWKYDIYSNADRPAGEPKWRVGERPVHPSKQILFKSDDLGECKRWIEEREYEGGYAKSRPVSPDGEIQHSKGRSKLPSPGIMLDNSVKELEDKFELSEPKFVGEFQPDRVPMPGWWRGADGEWHSPLEDLNCPFVLESDENPK